jgi:hypothetical protein
MKCCPVAKSAFSPRRCAHVASARLEGCVLSNVILSLSMTNRRHLSRVWTLFNQFMYFLRADRSLRSRIVRSHFGSRPEPPSGLGLCGNIWGSIAPACSRTPCTPTSPEHIPSQLGSDWRRVLVKRRGPLRSAVWLSIGPAGAEQGVVLKQTPTVQQSAWLAVCTGGASIDEPTKGTPPSLPLPRPRPRLSRNPPV